jgi:hypothetical protein
MVELATDPLNKDQDPQNPGQTDAPNSVDPVEFAELKGKLDVFEKMAMNFNQPPPVTQAPISPPAYLDDIKRLEGQVADLDAQIDAAIADGTSTSTLRKQQRELSKQITRLEIKNEDIDPALSTGAETLGKISAEVAKGRMPLLSNESVKGFFEDALNNLPIDQRMNPAIQDKLYQMAIGANHEKIVEAKIEEALRSSVQDPNLSPGGKNTRTGAAAGPEIPKPIDVFGPEGLQALKMKGRTVDQHCQALGCSDYADWWEKVGKDYHGDLMGGDE